MWHIHELDLADLEELLLVAQDLLEKIFVYHFLWRHVQLEVLGEVLEKVFLGTELTYQL